ncbi:MAG: hypothetical protein M3445_02460 [Actinomycetota bacterium]|nr:hypothetical protein [Actinomycetota bacterium]
MVRARKEEDAGWLNFAGLHHRLTDIRITEVVYLREVEEDGTVSVPPLGGRQVLQVFEVFSDSSAQSAFDSLDADGEFLAVLDYGYGHEQAERTGGWSVQSVAVDGGDGVEFVGLGSDKVTRYFDAATALFVPDEYPNEVALLAALVEEAASSFSSGRRGLMDTAVQGRLDSEQS